MDQRIKQIRKDAGLTQGDFAKRLNISQQTVTAYETGNRVPSNAIITLMCREYDIDENWLRTGEGVMHRVHTIEDALGDLFGAVAADDPDSFRKKVFLGLATLSPEDWATVERILIKMLGQNEKPG